MPATQLKRVGPSIALAVSASTLSACSSLPFFGGTEVYSLFTGDADSAWCVPGDESRLLESGADLRGPHFALSLMCSFTGTEIPDAVDSGDLSELQEADADTEFVIAQFALSDAYEAEAETGEVAGVWIEADGEKLALDALPAPGGYIALTVPTGGDVVLWVEDEDRAQGIDLRSGERVEPVAAYYSGLTTDPVVIDQFAYEDLSIVNDTDAYRVTCGSDTLEGQRSVWREELGWAEEGTVFLEVSFTWCSYEDPGILWHLGEGSLAARTGDAPAQALSWTEFELGEEFHGDLRYEAVFAIPEEAAAATLVFTPIGDLENLDGGADYAFAYTPDPIERELVF
ncbi:hypothetical protein [Glycomyces paridis]|uniref:Uncharacterized protein n=1 Tax=Glycomyces paridis TaxID=2126555 RepID=A0A4S8PKY6_9ACTN|nr:hypothetical protein [Glycomyces paridis]THV28964.1 hypothetical protein E9998_09400 [Glycomyces paridis]